MNTRVASGIRRVLGRKGAGALLLVPWLCACEPAGAAIIVPKAVPSKSKISIHLIGEYTLGAAQIVAAHPRVLKILDTGDAMLQAARGYKSKTPEGKVVLRVYTPVHYSISDDPRASGQHFWNTILAPPLNALSAADRALIDFVEGPNEGDSTPTFQNQASAAWYNQFWLALAPLISGAGFRPCAFSIAVGNPPGSMAEIYQTLDALAPALRLVQSLGGAWSYHGYTLPYSQDVGQEIWYSLRYRQYYSYFQTHHPELAKMPLIITEGGVDGQAGDPGPGWLGGGEEKYKSWLQWYDQQIRQDDYVLGCTLFESGAPGSWGSFEIEPIAEWLAGYISGERPASSTPFIALSPPSLNATVSQGQAVPDYPLAIANASGGTLSYTLSGNAAWLTNLPQSGDSTGEQDALAIYGSAAGLSTGTHHAYITASDPASSNSPVYVPVTLTVEPAIPADPVLSVSPDALEAAAIQGANPPDTSLAVRNGGAGTLSYRVTDNADWLTVTPDQGTSTGESDSLAVSFATGALPAGTLTAVITVADEAGLAPSVQIPVTVAIRDVTAPQISALALAPACTRSGSTVGASATVRDNAGGTGVAQGNMLLLGTESLTNPSFEDSGGLTGWDNPGGYIIGNTYPHPGAAKDGSKYAGMSCGYSSGVQNPELRRTLSVTPGQPCLLSVWVNTQGSPNTCSAFLQWKDGEKPTGDGQCATVASVASNTTGWQQLRGVVTPQTGTLTICLRLSWDCAGAGGGGNFDLASVCAAWTPGSYDQATGAAAWPALPVIAGHNYPLMVWDGAGNGATAAAGVLSLDDLAPSTTASAPAKADAAFDVNWTATDNGCNGQIQTGSVRLHARRSNGTWGDSGLAAQSGGSGAFRYQPSVYGLYYLSVTAADGLGNALTPPTGSAGSGQTQVYYHAPAVSIGMAKHKPDGEAVYVGNGHSAIVTAAFPGYFYAQQGDGSCGIQVQWASALKPGTRVEIDGVMGTSADFERFIAAEAVTTNGTGSTPVRKLVTREMGGDDCGYAPSTGAGQRAARAWQWILQPDKTWRRELANIPGVNNIGLCVLATATVLSANGTAMVVDDGSNVDDGDPKLPGVKVALPPGMAAPAAGTLVRIRGISSCYRANGDTRRLLRIAAPEDLTVLFSPT